MQEKEPEFVLIKEWDKLSEALATGVHWLEVNQSPLGQQGVFINISPERNYWFYPVRRIPDQDRALQDAQLFYKYLTNREGVLKMLGLETKNGFFRWLDQILSWYANPDAKPRP